VKKESTIVGRVGNGVNIFDAEPFFLIAEAGVNHEGRLETARRLVFEAAEGGADAIKFQTYRASTLASQYSPAYWDTDSEPTTSQYQLFKKYDRFWKNEFEQLKTWCDDAGIEFMSTPFDLESANFLNDLMNVFKISSSDITNRPFIEYISDFGKPLILSTGASDVSEIDRALSWVSESGAQVALLHCVLSYPTSDEDANLYMIRDLQHRFPENVVGYSDHTLPRDMRVLETAWLLGARILEKHFTHDKTLPGNDHYHAMDKSDLIHFRRNVTDIRKILGEREKRPLECESLAREHARRSLVAADRIVAGTVVSPGMLTWKRPGNGISPADINNLIGRKAAVDIAADEVLKWEHFA